MAPHFDPYRRQWLQNLIQIGVNGSTFRSKSASTAPEFDPYWRQWLQNLIQIGVNGSRFFSHWPMWSHWRRFGSNSGAIDADLDENVEPLTPIRIKFWSHWRRYGSKCGAIDTISSRFSTEILTWGAFLGGLNNSNEFFEGITVLRGSKGFTYEFFVWSDRVPLMTDYN